MYKFIFVSLLGRIIDNELELVGGEEELPMPNSHSGVSHLINAFPGRSLFSTKSTSCLYYEFPVSNSVGRDYKDNHDTDRSLLLSVLSSLL